MQQTKKVFDFRIHPFVFGHNIQNYFYLYISSSLTFKYLNFKALFLNKYYVKCF
jgi:hypothetical protein